MTFASDHVSKPSLAQYPFSYANGSRPAGDPWRPPNRLVPCHSTRTTAETEALVAALPSAVYDGAGGLGVGPRYCPSLESKARETASLQQWSSRARSPSVGCAARENHDNSRMTNA